jgi:BASS family bile acid:Na+ symporter
MARVLSRFTDLYPVWLIGGALLALWHPPAFSWFSGQWIVWALTLVMLGMGFTLTPADFARLGKMPGSLALGFLAHYTIMPLLGWGIGRVLRLEPGFAAGLILVATCPSGTASNVVSFLARADVALAVAVTLASTLFAFIMTPLWCEALVGRYIPVDALGLCLSTLQVVVAPVLIGVLCNWRFPRQVAQVARFGPTVSVIAIVFITGGIVAINAAAVLANLTKLALAAVLLHVLGFMLGYAVARALGYGQLVARTISIEVGMQNGGMAAMLARKNFPTEPLVAVPAVFSAVMQNLLGAMLAAYWRARPPKSNVRSEVAVAPAEVP